MKVIDLFELMLERKAPKKIKILGKTMRFVETAEWGDYLEIDGCSKLSDFRLIDCLNDEIEIIEEEKEIEEININSGDKYLKTNTDMPYYADFGKSDVLLATKINELIREVNKLKKEGK